MRYFALSIAAIIPLTLLGACGNSAFDRGSAPSASPNYEAADQGGFAKNSAADAAQSETNASSRSFLAYRYNYSFALPVDTVAPTAKAHVKLCRDAGPNICQVLSSSMSADQEDYASAYVQLRADPEWLKTFIQDIQNSVKDAKGDVTQSGVSAEDLTRSILDTDARLKAQLTLRARLEKLLETRDAELPDLLALERELARVQGDIESATSTLNALEKRVSMSVVDLNYQSKQAAVSRGAFAPIGMALKDFARNVSHGIASVIQFLSFILPWIIFILLPLLWLIRRFWKRKKTAA